jgi:hypothetical protein
MGIWCLQREINTAARGLESGRHELERRPANLSDVFGDIFSPFRVIYALLPNERMISLETNAV